MTDFTEQQIPEMARRVLAERDAGRSVDPQRIAWAEDVLQRDRLAADQRFAQWAARAEARAHYPKSLQRWTYLAGRSARKAPSVPAVPEALLRYLRDTSQDGSVAEKIVANTALQLLAAAPHPAAKGGAT